MSNRVLCYSCFTCWGMCTNKYIFIWFYSSNWLHLEGIEGKRIDFGFEFSLEYFSLIVLWEIDLMNATFLSSDSFNFDIFQSFIWNLFVALLILLWRNEFLWPINLILVDDFSWTLLLDRLRSCSLDRLLKNGERIVYFHCWEYSIYIMLITRISDHE